MTNGQPAAPPFVFRRKLLNRGLHFDFMRLRCGSESAFHESVQKIAKGAKARPRTFIAFSEWDAVVVTPCSTLYPDELNQLYGSPAVASTIAGTAGYFAYLWNHPINADLDRKLNEFSSGGCTIVTTLRLEDWFRREVGLGAELLLCDFLQRELKGTGLRAIVAHTLGWNDAVVMIHARTNEQALTGVLSRLRVATARDFGGANASRVFGAKADGAVFAASYTHLLGSYDAYVAETLSFGELAAEIESALLLVRVTPEREFVVRKQIAAWAKQTLRRNLRLRDMPAEMGHYSFSIDVTALARNGDGQSAVRLISAVRKFIGDTGETPKSSYPETSTILCFREDPPGSQPVRLPQTADPAIEDVSKLMSTLIPEMRRTYKASAMSVHRFAAVLTTLLDHLSDPVRSSVVRHMARFVADTAKTVATLQRDQLEDFCHICEYAMTQATDGIAQFQHDANALGLTGRGGYSRLIVATETYVQDLFSALELDRHVLITFGLRTGHAGVTGRFQIDVPFNVLFTPSRWYVLLHEAAHIIWVHTFGWMHETLAVFEHFETEIRISRKEMHDDDIERIARLEFIRTREIVRELFPNLLVWQVGCRGDLGKFDRLSLRHIVSTDPGFGTRELLIAVVLHALFKIIADAEADGPLAGRDWWHIWDGVDKARMTTALADAIHGIDAALSEEAQAAQGSRTVSIASKQKLLGCTPFGEAVHEALDSVVRVLALSGRQFSTSPPERPDPAERMFTRIQEDLQKLRDETEAYATWRGDFREWLVEGEVLAVAPRGHVWCELLLNANLSDVRRGGPEGAFMISQLSPILALWHRGVTGENATRTKQVLFRLGLAKPRT